MNPTRQYPPTWAERCFAVGALFFFTGALFPMFGDKGLGLSSTAREGNIGIQAVFTAIYVVTFALILPRLGLFLGLWRQNKALLLLVGLALMSILWSVEPGLSFRRLVALLGTVAFGVYLVMRFQPEQLLLLLAWAMGIIAVLSLAFEVVLPELGVHNEGPAHGAWRGVFGHKNKMGEVITPGMLVFLMLASERGSYRWLAWIGLGLCGLLVAMSGSRTAWVIAALLLMFLALLQVQRKAHYSVAIPAIMVAILAFGGGITWVVSHLETATALIGRDPTLTGRMWLWSVFAAEMDQPLFGYGYRAYWYSPSGSRLRYGYGISAISAHSGYLNLWLSLGFAGIVAFLLTVLVGLRRLIARLPYIRDPFGLWLPALFGYCLLYTIPTSILSNNGLVTVLYVATLFYWTGPPVATEATRRQLRQVAIIDRFEDRKGGARVHPLDAS